MAQMTANPKYPNSNGWQDRHNSAVAGRRLLNNPHSDFEQALRQLLAGWDEYAQTHRKAYESAIGEDGVLGKHWEEIGDALRGLLNGELGRFDGGTLDAFILDTMRENGVDVEHK